MALPTHVRVIAVILAVFVSFTQLSAGVANFLDAPVHGGTQVLVGGIFVALFAWVAAWPRHADATLRDRFGWDLSDGKTFAGILLHVVFVYLVFAGTVVETARGLSHLIETGEHPAGGLDLTDWEIVLNLLFNFVLFTVAAVTWLVLVNKKGTREIFASLELKAEGAPKAVVAGVVTAIVTILAFGAALWGLQSVGYEPQNPQAEAIAGALTLETALLVALLAGLGEELYFRGFLLPRTGNTVQAALFALVHATYLVPLQVVLPFVLGLVFGWLTRRTNLWAAIVAHFAFNAIMLVGALYGEELAAAASLIV